MKAVDHTGKRYGRLVGVCFTGESGSRGRIWKFKCDCGNFTEISGSLAKTGHTQSCGCLQREAAAGQLMDRTGTRNGRLTFTHFVKRAANGNNVWAAQCDCGGTIETGTPYKTKSCGCLQREWARSRATCFKGKRHGRLVFTKRLKNNKHGQIVWQATCDCGKTTSTVNPRRVKSCGCLAGDVAAKRMKALAMSPDEKVIAKRKAWRKYREGMKGCPIRSMRMRISGLHNVALKRVGALKTSSTFEMLGYTAEELAAHIERQFSNGMGWHNRDKWHIDHIVPISTAKTVEDVVALNQLSNLRTMWASDNIRKKDNRMHLI